MADDARPAVSVIMANYNGAPFIEAAIASVLAQSMGDLELIVSDDASTDDSLARVHRIAARDPRVRALRSTTNAGPAGARNAALDVARGRWIAVMDSDDLIHPERLERLVDAAERDGADMAADDLLAFADDRRARPFTCLHGEMARTPQWLGIAQFIRANAMYARNGVLGYLKPIVSAALLARTGIRYDTRLSISEDYDFALRLLVAGARYRVYPELTYFYRRHRSSTSYRISGPILEALLEVEDELRDGLSACGPGVAAAFDGWRSVLLRAIRFDRILVALKRRDLMAALGLIARDPRAGALLYLPALQRFRRLFAARRKQELPAKRVCVLSRQSSPNASSAGPAYLLSLCDTLCRQGVERHFVSLSPEAFERFPALILRPELRRFQSVAIRGGWRIGRVVVAHDPRVLAKAARAMLKSGATRLGIGAHRAAKPAGPSAALPLSREEMLFVARHAHKADAVIADGAVSAEAIAYALRPDAPSVVVVHDLCAIRSARLEGAPEWLVRLDDAREVALLARADVVVAAQTEEAEIVRRALPRHRVIVAPAAAPTAAGAFVDVVMGAKPQAAAPSFAVSGCA